MMSEERREQVEAAFRPAATLEERQQRIEAARQMVSDLCNGRQRWLMSIPVQPTDPDIVLSAALRDALDLQSENTALRARVAELDAQWASVPWDEIRRTLHRAANVKNVEAETMLALHEFYAAHVPQDPPHAAQE